jgi:hypothetical protein
VTAGAFNEAAVDNDGFAFILAQQGGVIFEGLAVGFGAVPFLHVRNGKQKLNRAGYVLFFVAVLVGHGVDDQHLFAGINPFFQFLIQLPICSLRISRTSAKLSPRNTVNSCCRIRPQSRPSEKRLAVI